MDTLEDKKAEDIVLLDVREQSSFADYFVICAGTSDRQLAALAEALSDTARKKHRLKAPRQEGQATHGWVLVDFGNVIVHLFSAAQRQRYRLEELWQTGKVIVRIQ